MLRRVAAIRYSSNGVEVAAREAESERWDGGGMAIDELVLAVAAALESS